MLAGFFKVGRGFTFRREDSAAGAHNLFQHVQIHSSLRLSDADIDRLRLEIQDAKPKRPTGPPELSEQHLQHRFKMKGKTIAKKDGKIFIGHGHSSAWKDLKIFIQDNLALVADDFNRESPAGLSNKERLLDMLDGASFAFLVMTAEDEKADGTKHPRENVIHEAGLFQGRLGFERAIILLEEGCEEFSNIHGLGQIRFPSGKIISQSEEIRKVLKREEIIS
jgi:predicted nucleotide-binding protein